MKLLKIKSITKETYNDKIYDLEIKNTGTYNIENIVVGNCSGGLHGIGIKCTNALSKYFKVTVKRNGIIYSQEFSKGKQVTDVEQIGTCDINDTGTIVEYIPDGDIFKQTIEPSDASIQSRLDEITSLNAGLKINYKNDIENVDKLYYQKDGIKGYIKRLAGDKKLLFEDAFYIKDNYVMDATKTIIVEAAFIYDDEDKPHETFKSFANNINTHEGGYHLQGFRNGFKKAMNDYIEKNNLFKNSVELRYLMDGIYAIVSVKVPEAEFEGQTKSKLGNEEAQIALETIMEKEFATLIKSRKEDLNAIADRAIRVKVAEEAARKYY